MAIFAVVGSGPAGFYTADLLSKSSPDNRVDLIERLAFPFGLIRYGVAADHQGTKNIVRVFTRTMKRDNIQFFGGVDVGRDVSLAELQAHYDAVVVATGASVGRKAGIVGADHVNSLSAFDLARWFNAHPELTGLSPPAAARSVCIIGNGNVSLDIARLIAKGAEGLAGTDIADVSRCWLSNLGVEEIHICGRRGAGYTSFSAAELMALDELSEFRPTSHLGSALSEKAANPDALRILQRFANRTFSEGRLIHFHFDLDFLTYDGRQLLIHDRVKDATQWIPANFLVHAVGQRCLPVSGLPFDASTGIISNVGGRVSGLDNVYVVGWAAHPGIGGIANNRAYAQTIVHCIKSKAETHSSSARAGLSEYFLRTARTVVSWRDWLRIDQFESEEGRRRMRVRHKLINRQDVETILKQEAC